MIDCSPEEVALAAKFVEARKAFLANGLLPAIAAARAGDVNQASELVAGEAARLFRPVNATASQMIDLQQSVAKAEYEESQSVYETVRPVCLAGLGFGLLMAAVVGWMLVRAIVRPIKEAVRIAGAVAAGEARSLAQRSAARRRPRKSRP